MAVPVQIPGGTGPAEARALRDRLKAALEEARRSGTALGLEAEIAEGARIGPTAIQLIAAACRSADEDGIAIVLGPVAAASLGRAAG